MFSNIILIASVRVLSEGASKPFKSVDFEQSRLPTKTWVGLTQSVEVLHSTKTDFPWARRNSGSWLPLDSIATLPWTSSLLAYPGDFGLTEPSSSVQFSSLSRVWLFATPWITARQAFLSINNSRSSLRLTSIESVMPSSHLILCRPFLLLPPIPPSIRVFSNESTLRMRWPKYWSFSFSIIPSKEIPGLIFFRMDWLDRLAVQGTLKSLLQHHSSKASSLHHSMSQFVKIISSSSHLSIYLHIPNPDRWCWESATLNMPANLENSAVATGLQKVSLHSNPKERQCQRISQITAQLHSSHTLVK